MRKSKQGLRIFLFVRYVRQVTAALARASICRAKDSDRLCRAAYSIAGSAIYSEIKEYCTVSHLSAKREDHTGERKEKIIRRSRRIPE